MEIHCGSLKVHTRHEIPLEKLVFPPKVGEEYICVGTIDSSIYKEN